MKKITTLLLCATLLLLAGCGAKQADEPFSAKFEITSTTKPTEVFFEAPEHVDGETNTEQFSVPTDNTIDFGALRQLLQDTLFTEDDNTATRWTSRLAYTVEGEFSQEDTVVISDTVHLLTQVQNFPGVQEVNKGSENIRILFDDSQKAGYSIEKNPNGSIAKGEIHIPASASEAEKETMLTQNILHICGFRNTADTTLSSALSTTPATEFTESDFILLDILYGSVEPGDSVERCMEHFDAFFKL